MAWNDIANGAATGATAGSVVPGIGTALGTGLGGLLGGAFGGLFGRKQKEQLPKVKETDIQKKQKELVDQLLGSLNGNGPYSHLFTANEDDFQRSFVDPAKSRFKNQIAPQIQQSYISNGQQNGTGLEGQLARAGVDMDALLNQHYLNYKQSAQDRQANAINSILGLDKGYAPQHAAPAQSWGNAALQGVGGYFSGDSFGNDFKNILDSFKKKPISQQPYEQQRKGFENEYTGPGVTQ